MNFEKCVAAHLEDNGMWPNDVLTVVALIKENMKDTMERRWADEITDYPPGMKTTVLLHARGVAYKWLQENQPFAWFLPMFAPSAA